MLFSKCGGWSNEMKLNLHARPNVALEWSTKQTDKAASVPNPRHDYSTKNSLLQPHNVVVKVAELWQVLLNITRAPQP